MRVQRLILFLAVAMAVAIGCDKKNDNGNNSAPTITVTAGGNPVAANGTVNVAFNATLASVNLQITVNDADANETTLSAGFTNHTTQGLVAAEFGSAAQATGYTVTPTTGTFSVGSASIVVTLTADDGKGGTASFTFTFATASDPVGNDVPTIVVKKNGTTQSANAIIGVNHNSLLSTLNMSVEIADADNDTVNLTAAVTATSWTGYTASEWQNNAAAPYTLNPGTGTFDVASTDHAVTLTANDGNGGTANFTFTFRVGAPIGGGGSLNAELVGTWDGRDANNNANGETLVIQGNYLATRTGTTGGLTFTPGTAGSVFDRITDGANDDFDSNGPANGTGDNGSIDFPESFVNTNDAMDLIVFDSASTGRDRTLFADGTWRDDVYHYTQAGNAIAAFPRTTSQMTGDSVKFSGATNEVVQYFGYSINAGQLHTADQTFTAGGGSPTTVAGGSPWTSQTALAVGFITLRLTYDGTNFDFDTMVSTDAALTNIVFQRNIHGTAVDANSELAVKLTFTDFNYEITGSGSGAILTIWNTTGINGTFVKPFPNPIPVPGGFLITDDTGDTFQSATNSIPGTWNSLAGGGRQIIFNANGTYTKGAPGAIEVEGRWRLDAGRCFLGPNENWVKQ